MLLLEFAAAAAVAAVTHDLDSKLVVADCSLDCIGCSSAARTEDMCPHIVAGGYSFGRIAVTARNLHTVDVAVLPERTEHQAGKYSLVV